MAASHESAPTLTDRARLAHRRTKVAFIGLGTMGAPMARRLHDAGHHVTGYNRSPAARAAFGLYGGRVAGNAIEAVRGAQYVLLMLPNGPDVFDVLTNEETGVLRHLTRGSIICDLSTISPDTAVELHQLARSVGVGYLDAPVSGGEPAALKGTLSVMVGGDQEDYEAALPLLDTLGTFIRHVGGPGDGQRLKAANQLIVAGNLAVLAEALAYLRTTDLNLETALEVLNHGLAGSAVISQKARKLLTGDFTPGFTIALHLKDLDIVHQIAARERLPLAATAIVHQYFLASAARGDEKLDHSAIAQTIRAIGQAAAGTP